MNIAIISKKGGVGKSTIALLLYNALLLGEYRVQLQDWDAQGTSNKSLGLRPGEGISNPEIILFDTPPSLDHPATSSAIRASDLVLVVSTTAPADIWETEDSIRFAKTVNPYAKMRVVFNKVESHTSLGKLLNELSKNLSVSVIPISITYRQCYKQFISAGISALNKDSLLELKEFMCTITNTNSSK